MAEEPTKKAPIVAIPAVKIAARPAVVSSSTGGGSLNLGKLNSSTSQKKYLADRKKTPLLVSIIKGLAILLFVTLSSGYIWLKFDMDHDNAYFKLAGIETNTYQKHLKLSSDKKKLEQDLKEIKDEIKDKQQRIEEGRYSLYEESISAIRSTAFIPWFDEIDKDGNRKLGAYDSVKKIRDFFVARDYTDPDGGNGTITGRQILSRNSLEIDNLTISRKSVTVSVKATNILGKIFFLSTEFVDMMNSLPFFKNGVIKSFNRQEGTDMNFLLVLEIQQPDEEDPADIRFGEFEKWETAQNKLSNTGKKPRRTRPSAQKESGAKEDTTTSFDALKPDISFDSAEVIF